MGKGIYAEELLKFSIWAKRIIRNDMSAFGFKSVVRSFFSCGGERADEIIDSLISNGYAEYTDDGDIKVLQEQEKRSLEICTKLGINR